jgi:hypothetical protein
LYWDLFKVVHVVQMLACIFKMYTTTIYGSVGR